MPRAPRAPVLAALLALLLAMPVMLGSAAATDDDTLDDDTREALLAALDDERKSQATYRAVMDRLGEVRPFTHVAGAEGRHIAHLLPLFERYGLQVPADPWPERAFEVPATRQEACAEAAANEVANAALYDRLLEAAQRDDVRQAFVYLRDASRLHHLVAFERCAGSTGAGEGDPGMGRGARMGHGEGMGRGGGRGMGHGARMGDGEGMGPGGGRGMGHGARMGHGKGMGSGARSSEGGGCGHCGGRGGGCGHCGGQGGGCRGGGGAAQAEQEPEELPAEGETEKERP